MAAYLDSQAADASDDCWAAAMVDKTADSEVAYSVCSTAEQSADERAEHWVWTAAVESASHLANAMAGWLVA